jgi:cytochrome c556
MRPLMLLLLAAMAMAQAPANQLKSNGPKPHGNLKQVMRSVPLPNSDIIFEVQSKTPKNDMEWRTVENAAIAIQETANLILLPGRLRSNGQPVPVQATDYIQFAQALVQAGGKCLKAAQMRNLDAISNCTDVLSEACDNCHKVYRDKP